MLIKYFFKKLLETATAAVMLGQMSVEMPKQPDTQVVSDLSASAISVNCIKAKWDADEGKDYELSITPTDENTGYTDNICIKFQGKNTAYITGLREGSEYEIVIKQLDKNGEPIDDSAAENFCKTETVEVIENFEHEDGWTGAYAYENAKGLTLQPSWGAIQGCFPDPITGTGIMRDEYGDYCCAMGTVYGYVGDRFLISLSNGVQFTVKICDSKGDRAYHPFGNGGKCIVEFIHADGQLPGCVSLTGNYGSFYWDGLIFDNIERIQKINYGSKVEY